MRLKNLKLLLLEIIMVFSMLSCVYADVVNEQLEETVTAEMFEKSEEEKQQIISHIMEMEEQIICIESEPSGPSEEITKEEELNNFFDNLSLENYTIQFVSAKNGLNVRNKVGDLKDESTIITALPYMAEVRVIGALDGWSCIDYNGEKAFVMTQYLTGERSYSYTDHDLYLLAHIISGEAQGCDNKEQQYVASVVMNRVNHNRYPNTIEKVIYQPGQYACVMDGNCYNVPTEANWENARYILENGSILPENVIYQSGGRQGKGEYIRTKWHSYCY